jgi:hypothetical protein
MIVYVTKHDFEEAQRTDCVAWYYLTVEDLFENEGIVDFVEIELDEDELEIMTDNTVDVSGVEIDIQDLNMN